MNVIEELIATGMAKKEDFEIFHVGVFERVGAQLADDNSDVSRNFAAAQRRQYVAWSEMSQQVLGAERQDFVSRVVYS